MSTGQIAALTAQNVANLQPTALAALSTAQLQALSANQLNALGRSQIEALTDAQVAAIAPTTLANLQPRAIRALTTSQIQSLTLQQLGQLTASQIADLKTNADLANDPNDAAVADLTPQQMANLTAAQLQALTPAEIQSLSAPQLQALSTQQLGELLPIQLQSLTTSQLNELLPAQIESLIVPLQTLGYQVVQPGGAPYTGSDSVADNGSIVAGDNSQVQGENFVVVAGSDGSETIVLANGSLLPNGNFADPISGGSTTSASTPPTGWSTYTPPVPSASAPSIQLYNDIVNAFYNWIGTVPGYGQGGESNTTAINFITGLLTDTGDFTSDQLAAAQTGLQNALNWSPIEDANGGNTSAMQASTPRYAATVLQSISSLLLIPNAPFANLVGTTTTLNPGWYYAADPNDSNFQIGYDVETGQWDFQNLTTGSGVIASGLGTAATYDQAYQAYQAAYGDAPPEFPPSETYTDAGFAVAPTNGTQAFLNSGGDASSLLGNTGVLSDPGDASVFAPPGSATAGVIGADGSISQTVAGLQSGQWYAISFQAMTSVFDEIAQGSDQPSQDLGDQVAAPQSIEVTLDGENLGVFSAGSIPDANPLSATSDWQEFATAAFLGSPGNHTVTFTGLGPNGATSSITLDNLQLLQVTPVGSVSGPQGGISSLTPAQISALSGIQLIAANDDDLQNLNQQQFQAITPQQLSFFWGSSIYRFTPTQLGWLTTTQISGLGSDQIEWLGAAVLNSFSQQQLQALPTLSTIATSVLAQLSTGTLSEFTAQQAATLTRAQLASLSGQQLTALNAGVWGLFDAAQVNGLSIEQLAALPQSSISAISNSAAQGLAIGGSLQSWLTSSRTASSPPPLASLSGHVTAISTSGTLAVAISAVTASLGDNGGAYLWNGSSWNALPGNWQKVVTSPDGSIWGINDSGEVERYVINQWVDEGERASDIAAGSDGSLFAVGTSGNLLQWDSGSWNNLGGSLSKVAVGADGSLWAIGTDTNVYQFQPIVLQRYTAGRWANQGLIGRNRNSSGGLTATFLFWAEQTSRAVISISGTVTANGQHKPRR